MHHKAENILINVRIYIEKKYIEAERQEDITSPG